MKMLIFVSNWTEIKLIIVNLFNQLIDFPEKVYLFKKKYPKFMFFYYKKAMSINNKIIETKLDIDDKQEQINSIRLNLKKLAKTIRKNNEK